MAVSETGKLNKRLTFFYKNGTKKGANAQKIPNWEPKFKCWFGYKQKYLNQIKNELGGELEDSVTVVIRQKQKEEVSAEWQIDIKGKKHEILKINPDVENEAFLVIICKAVS